MDIMKCPVCGMEVEDMKKHTQEMAGKGDKAHTEAMKMMDDHAGHTH